MNIMNIIYDKKQRLLAATSKKSKPPLPDFRPETGNPALADICNSAKLYQTFQIAKPHPSRIPSANSETSNNNKLPVN